MSVRDERVTASHVGNGGDPRDIERDIERTRANMSDTLDALERKLSPGQLLDEAMSYMEVGPGAFLGNLGATVRDNPVPVAMIGAGLAWMMFSGRRSHAEPEWEDEGYADAYDDPFEPGHGAAAMGEGPEAESPGLTRRVAGAASEAGRRIGDAVSEAGERVRHATGDAAAMAERVVRRTSRRLDDARHVAGRQATRVGRGMTSVMDEQPLLVGLVGLAVGAAIGAALPRTRREHAMFGEASDQAVRRAKEMGREQIRRARDIGTAAFEAAREEAKEAGLTGEGVAGAIRQAGEKIESMVEAGTQAAHEEATGKPEGRRGKGSKAATPGGTMGSFEPREGDDR